ncbi:MAG TPA: sigma-70 family RNA polymerase sigma factor, partial [Anaerolineae bacterium]
MLPTDEALLNQYKAGDERSFRILIERYNAPIYNLAFRFLRDSMEAENVTQETFLRIVTVIERIHLDTPFKPYLFRVAVNLCRDLARKKHPILFTELNSATRQGDGAEPVDASEAIPDDSPPLWELLEHAELRSRLNVAMDALPLVYKAVITLRFTEEFSYEEIAQTLDLPLNTVRTHLRRAKAQLRLGLEHE